MLAARRLVSPRFFSTAADGSVEDGLFNVPSEGPVLFVGNHQLFGLDGVHIVEEFLTGKAARPDAAGVPAATRRREPARAAALSITRVRGDVKTVRRRAGGREDADRGLEARRQGARLPRRRAGGLQAQGRSLYVAVALGLVGLVRIAAKFNATIIPFAGVGGDEFFGNEAYALDTDDLLTMDNRVGAGVGDHLLRRPTPSTRRFPRRRVPGEMGWSRS